MSRLINTLSAHDSHIWTLRFVILILTGLLLGCLLVWHQASDQITVHIPPDLSQGATLHAGQLTAPTVYAFAQHIFQALNHWPDNGVVDQPRLLQEYSCYLTPEFRNSLHRSAQRKQRRGELQRTRGVYPLTHYRAVLVQQQSAALWQVRLDLGLREWVRDRAVKETQLRYELRVVRHDVSRQCNPWGLALDGYATLPRRIDAALTAAD